MRARAPVCGGRMRTTASYRQRSARRHVRPIAQARCRACRPWRESHRCPRYRRARPAAAQSSSFSPRRTAWLARLLGMEHALEQVQDNSDRLVEAIEPLLYAPEMSAPGRCFARDRARRLGGSVAAANHGCWAERGFRSELFADLAHDRIYVGWLENVLFAQKPGEHQPVTKGIDAPRDAGGGRMDQGEA